MLIQFGVSTRAMKETNFTFLQMIRKQMICRIMNGGNYLSRICPSPFKTRSVKLDMKVVEHLTKVFETGYQQFLLIDGKSQLKLPHLLVKKEQGIVVMI